MISPSSLVHFFWGSALLDLNPSGVGALELETRLGISRGLGIPSGGKSKIAMENVGKSMKFHYKWRFDWANHLINGGFSSRV